jgi:hypothetical protein
MSDSFSSDELIQEVIKGEEYLAKLLGIADIVFLKSIHELNVENAPSSISPIGLIQLRTILYWKYGKILPLGKFYPNLEIKFKELKKKLDGMGLGKETRESYLDTLMEIHEQIAELEARVISRKNIEVPIQAGVPSEQEEIEAKQLVEGALGYQL